MRARPPTPPVPVALLAFSGIEQGTCPSVCSPWSTPFSGDALCAPKGRSAPMPVQVKVSVSSYKCFGRSLGMSPSWPRQGLEW